MTIIGGGVWYVLDEKSRDRDRVAQELVAQKEIARLAQEKIDKIEADRVAKEKARLAQEKIDKIEADRVAKEKARLAQEKIDIIEADRVAKEKARLEKERKDKIEAERIAQEWADAREKERIAQELAEAKERARQNELRVLREELERQKRANRKPVVQKSPSYTKYRVTNVPSWDTLNVRRNAYVKHNKLGELSPYAKNIRIIKCKYNNKGVKWCKIRASNGLRGWVVRRCLRRQ